MMYLYSDNRYVLKGQHPYPISLGEGFLNALDRIPTGSDVVATYSFPLSLADAPLSVLHDELYYLENNLKKLHGIVAILLDCEPWKPRRMPESPRRQDIILIQNRLYSICYSFMAPVYWYRYGDSDHFLCERTLGEHSYRGYYYGELLRAINDSRVRHIFVSLGYDYVLRSELPDWVPGQWSGYWWSSTIALKLGLSHTDLQKRINALPMWEERAKAKALALKNWPWDYTIYPNPIHAPQAFEVFNQWK